MSQAWRWPYVSRLFKPSTHSCYWVWWYQSAGALRLCGKPYEPHGVHAHQKGGELAISGEIKRRRTSSVTGGGHLDIAVVGPDGKVVEYVSTIQGFVF